MERHPVDLVSLVFGIVFLGAVAAAATIGVGGWDTFTANVWLIPVAVILLGVGILATSLRRAN